MKKAWIFLIVVALLTLSVPLFADGPTVKFSMLGFWWANYDPSVTAAGANSWMAGGYQRVWPTADVAFDANNTLEIGLRFHSDAITKAVNENAGGMPTMDLADSLWHFMWTSDLTKSAGMTDLPVDVKVTIGLMDSVLTNWWYDNNGWEWEYGGWNAKSGSGQTPGTNWDSQLVTINADSAFLGYGLAVGAGPLTFHWVNDFQMQNTLLGVEGAYMGFAAFVSYGIYTGSAYGNSNLAIEAKYDVPEMNGIKLTPSAFYRSALQYSHYVFGGDLTVGYQMFKLIVGATSTDFNSLAHYSGTLFINPSDPAQLWIGAYLDGSTYLGASGGLQAVDIGASYKFGAFKLIVGWVVGGNDQVKGPVQSLVDAGTQAAQYNAGNNVTLGNDNVGGIRNGLYFGSAINF